MGLFVFLDRKYRLPRIWSNNQIRQLAPFFDGHIVNVSGWDDRDKEGGYYRNYFTRASSYTVTNYSGERGYVGKNGEIYLDLTRDLSQDLVEKFDVCFNHTTLEHIFDVRKAFRALCKMTRDIVFCTVPFCQPQHETTSYKDFWRFTPTCLRYLFEENGLSMVYEAQSPYRNAGIYLLCIGSKDPKKWKNVLPAFEPIEEAGIWIGESMIKRFLKCF
jgi:hypothetical protein